MINYYLKIAGRNIIRSKGFSYINILGLAIGIACAFIVYLYIDYELSYDKNIKDYKRIYRIISDSYRDNSKPDHRAFSASALIPVLKDNYPQIESMCYFDMARHIQLKHNDKYIGNNNAIKADPDFFKVFPAKFLLGNAAINQPNTCVITKRIADVYFKDKNPLGEILNWDYGSYEIKGVIENMNPNSHINFDIILSFLPNDFNLTRWNSAVYIYVKLKPDTDVVDFDEEIRDVYKREMGIKFNPDRNQIFFVQAFKNIYFDSRLEAEIAQSGNINQLYLYSMVGFLILLIACINYMNLATARYLNRAKEIGVRKIIGAYRYDLIIQFLLESLLFTIIAHIIAMFLIEATLPYLNAALELNLQIDYLKVRVIIGIISLIIFTALISGSYPAFFLASFKPDRIFKESISMGRLGIVRRVLVVFQFTISIILIVSVFVISEQMSFMKDYELGFDKEHKLVVEFPEFLVNENTCASVKNTFLQIPSVQLGTFTNRIPGRKYRISELNFSEDKFVSNLFVNAYRVDEDYFSLFQLKFVAGKNFDAGVGETSTRHYIINETTVEKFGWGSPEEAVGKELNAPGEFKGSVVGVIKDHHFKGLHEQIEPQYFTPVFMIYKFLILDIHTSNYQQTIHEVEKVFKNIYPNAPFEYFFLDQDFNKQYKSEEQLGEVFAGLSGLGLFIGCLGLLGLTAFMVQRKTKEIGVRKVHGASNLSIIVLLVKEFSKWVLVANIISWPVAYYFMLRWLEDFAYHIDLSIWPFILAGLTTLIIANLTTVFQALKAAKANPVDSLKCE